nr:aldose 1-epimerase [Pelagibacterium limicola]
MDNDRQIPDVLPSSEVITLRKGALHAAFCPKSGGRMARLSHDLHGDILVPLDDPAFDPLQWPKAGAFPLIPYHNRMTGAQFTHAGRRFDLIAHPTFGGDAMHGPAQRRPWTVSFQGAEMLELALRYGDDGDWPFDFFARQQFRLRDDGLDVELTLVNVGTKPMPGGLGWHPYFVATFSDVLTCDAAKRWSVDALPRGIPPLPRDNIGQFPARRVTEHLTDWTHATVLLRDRVRVTLTADAFLPHLVIHRTPDYVCLEPVSHVAGVYGFPPETQQNAGFVVLEPGQAVSGNLSLVIASD